MVDSNVTPENSDRKPDKSALSSLQVWRSYIASNWDTYFKRASSLKIESKLAVLMTIALMPVYPSKKSEIKSLIDLIRQIPKSETLAKQLQKFFQRQTTLPPVETAAQYLVFETMADAESERAFEELLFQVGVVAKFQQKLASSPQFTRELLDDLWKYVKTPSALRVIVEKISAGQNIAIAGRDANIVINTYKGDKAALRSYLGCILADWNQPELGRILPIHSQEANTKLRLHNLFTSIDVWRSNDYEQANEEKLIELRFKAVDKTLREHRRPVLELIAAEPRLVITGGPGTGKSYLARYVAVCLAYACDPDAEKRDKVDGLNLLGASWLHGAILPIHVQLRDFAAAAEFPSASDKPTAKHLLRYLQNQMGDFGGELERYLTGNESNEFSAILILDGLDEVDNDQKRLILQRITENWANRFPLCRILVTSRNYAYRFDAKWRLSSLFASAELAPFTVGQIKDYIHNWYNLAALTRFTSFGGKVASKRVTKRLAEDFCQKADEDESLLPLLQQPLLLALLTLIHERNKKLPKQRAELYDATIDLLNRWNPTIDDSNFTEKLRNLQQNRVLDALKLAAFYLQRSHASYQRYPNNIQRAELVKLLRQQDRPSGRLGANVYDIVNYLGTRNGILVSDRIDLYRFPHLSIQEYLAACALIELYDECDMPEDIQPSQHAHWAFPENLVLLLSDDAYRWRNVALFVGAIIANNRGQDGRWTLIEELLPENIEQPLTEESVFRIYIAAEIWALDELRARLPSHNVVGKNLLAALEAIYNDNRLDAPENYRTRQIFEELKQQITVRN